MKIYSARHGQTDYNSRDIIQGTTDIELNKTGIKQAHELAAIIKESDKISIDLVIASPMKRAKVTAQIVAELNGLEVIYDERLREWDYGSFEGRHRTAEGFYNGKREFGVRMGSTGESILQLAHRVYSAVDDIIKTYPDKNVLMVSHGGVCRIIETYFHDMTTEQFSSWFMDNCQIIEYDLGV